jgi:hypothetical protein
MPDNAHADADRDYNRHGDSDANVHEHTDGDADADGQFSSGSVRSVRLSNVPWL